MTYKAWGSGRFWLGITEKEWRKAWERTKKIYKKNTVVQWDLRKQETNIKSKIGNTMKYILKYEKVDKLYKVVLRRKAIC